MKRTEAHYKDRNKTLEAASALRRRCDGQEDMTLAKLIEICKESGLPATPLAVTRLELNCQLFTRIGDCIAEYRDVQQLHLDRNRISRIENLTSLVHLRCLYLQGNAITEIEGLSGLPQLRLLNLSGNALCRLSGLDGLPRLEALLVADNQLSDGLSIQHLTRCTNISELDLSYNHLVDPEGVLQVLSAMFVLQTLCLTGNPLTMAAPHTRLAAPQGVAGDQDAATSGSTSGSAAPAHTPLAFYRRTVAARCQHLTALDHRAISPQERRYAEAWWAEEQANRQRAVSENAAGDVPGGGGEATEPHSAGVAVKPEEAPWDCSRLPLDVLYPVLTRLDARSLVKCALSCRHWCGVAAFPLAAQRRVRAQATLCDAAAAVPRLAETLTAVRRDELDELLSCGAPARPLVQLFFALDLLWRRYTHKRELARRRSMARRAPDCTLLADRDNGGCQWAPLSRSPLHGAEGCMEASGGGGEDERRDGMGVVGETIADGEKGAGGGSLGGGGSTLSIDDGEEEEKGKEVKEEDRGEGEGEGTYAVEVVRAREWGVGEVEEGEEERVSTEKSSSAAPANGPGLEVGNVGDEEDGEDEDEDEEQVEEEEEEEAAFLQGGGSSGSDGEEAALEEFLDLDSQTWRMSHWGAAMELLQSPAFPLPGLLEAWPMGPRALAALRCRTGSADDLEYYIPPLQPQDVARHNASAARLAEWLLGVEEHCRAAHELDAAKAWDWPGRIVRHATAAQDDHVADGKGPEGCGGGGWDADGVYGTDTANGRVDIPVDYGGSSNGAEGSGGMRGSGGDGGGSGNGGSVSSGGIGGGGGCKKAWWPSAVAAAREMRQYVADILAARRAAALAKAQAAAEARAQAEAAAAAAAVAVAAVAIEEVAAAGGTGQGELGRMAGVTGLEPAGASDASVGGGAGAARDD